MPASPNRQPFLPKTSNPRPPLPLKDLNPRLQDLEVNSTANPVKFQVITREGQDIIVGRIKVPTQTGHAFILRRFDTNAISLSTMFRASFPTAGEDAEKVEATWVRTNFDVSGANGGGRLRLAGTWVSPALALHLAGSYRIDHILPPLATAIPSNPQGYRKSNPKSVTPNPSTGSVVVPLAPTVTHTSSIVNVASATVPPPPSPPKSPILQNVSPVRQPPAKRRKESPAPATTVQTSSPPQAVRASRATPTKQAASSTPVKPASKRKPAKVIDVDDEEPPEVPGPNMEDDVHEQRTMIAELKAAKAAAAAAATTSPTRAVVPATPLSKKRSAEEHETPPLKFDMDVINAVEERALAGIEEDRPIVPLKTSRFKPESKALAWGTVFLAASFAAIQYMPTFWT